MSKTNKDQKSFKGFREFYTDDDRPKKKPNPIRESSKDKLRFKERIKNIETIMRSTKQNFSLDRSKIVGVGFRKKCDFTTSR